MAAPTEDPRQHAWWTYVPPSARASRLQASQRQRWQQRLGQRRSRIAILVGIYAILCAVPLLAGLQSLALLAVLPLLLLPALGYLVYWLTWKEFHH
ncbi:hypothetical protein KBY76_11265 [Synechococcus sp. GreenBA-s]|jgi:hypothetical protein|nr:hypothetical protein [Synechococcus sp. GreenBA-s]